MSSSAGLIPIPLIHEVIIPNFPFSMTWGGEGGGGAHKVGSEAHLHVIPQAEPKAQKVGL